MRNIFLGLVAALMFVVGSVQCSASDFGSTEEQAEAVALLNELRDSVGVDELYWDPDSFVQAAAEVRAEELEQYFSHTRPDGSDCFTALQEFDIGYRTCGENIAYGTALDAEGVIELWTNSPGHYANMVKGDFTEVGLASWHADDGSVYWVQMFIG